MESGHQSYLSISSPDAVAPTLQYEYIHTPLAWRLIMFCSDRNQDGLDSISMGGLRTAYHHDFGIQDLPHQEV
jgi:hypothetical protein